MSQFLLACLLEFLVKQPCFYFISSVIDIIINLAINGAVLIALKYAVGLL